MRQHISFKLPLIFVTAIGLSLFPLALGRSAHSQGTEFRFEDFVTIEEMADFLRSRLDSGSPREMLRSLFVHQGKATLVAHPTKPNVEKYLYDINLCRYYVWRWNISADYDQYGKLLQAYLNGEPIFPSRTHPKESPKVAENGGKAAIMAGQRPRPEADKGESSLAFLLYDGDADVDTTDDQLLVGAGPSRADPVNMGTMHIYKEVEPWRSIFDFDKAARIFDYDGDCEAADRLYQSR